MNALNVNIGGHKMTIAAVKFRVMPEDVDVNLKDLEQEIKQKIESFESGIYNSSEEEPIAFGLKALIITFAISESKEVDEVENAISKIEGVSSVELIDYRRAVG